VVLQSGSSSVSNYQLSIRHKRMLGGQCAEEEVGIVRFISLQLDCLDIQATTPTSNFGARTMLKAAQEALIESELRYRRLFNTAQDGILIVDFTTSLITDVNPFLLELLGYRREDVVGNPLWDFGLFKDRELSKAAFLTLKEKHYVRYEDLPLETKDGRAIAVEFVSNVYGEGVRKVIQCNIRDVTKRKHAEQTSQQLLQSRQLEAIGQLAGGVAHDFNNLLQVILGYGEMLVDSPNLNERERRALGKINEAGASAKNLTHRLLAFSRRQILEPVFMDLNEAVTEVNAMLAGLLGDDIELKMSLSPRLGTVKADPNQIEQVLMNLAINARDAMPKGGKVTFETANVTIDETYAQQHLFIKPGQYVLLSVSDTGTGMDAETQARVFEPFFTTKPAGKGTGLGLSTVFGIVRQSGGSIGIYSELGYGTTFKIHFPSCEEAVERLQETKPPLLLGGNEMIFVVEDTQLLRDLTRLLLEGVGYQVLDSGIPEEALRMAKDYVGPLPLLITDVVMPGMSGIGLAEEFAKIRPETKVLYTSGYADDAIARHGGLASDAFFLEKPFSRDALIRKVRTILDSLG
jgi:two-component system, cell cycle sensor histidine kinase and response regulator CckA